MNHYYILLLLIFLLIIFSILFHRSKSSNRKVQIQGLQNVRTIKKNIFLIQKHRGMSAAYLNGDKNILKQINTIRRTIKDNIHQTDENLSKNERWLSFLEHWQRLGQGDIKTTPENSFAQHTNLISNLLYLVEDEAEKGLLSSQFLPQFPQAGYVWREVICVTELIGQARAIGVGVATQASCSSIDNIRLSFLQQQISEVITKVLNDLYCLPKYQQQHKQLIKTVHNQADALIKTIEQELISQPKVTIDSQAYFDQASSVIKSIDDVFEHQLMQISDTLDAAIK
jgi:hypothetical protein